MSRPNLEGWQSKSVGPLLVPGVENVQAETREPQGRTGLFFYLGLALVALLTFLLYLGTIEYTFVADDFIFLNQLHFKYSSFADNFSFFGQDWGLGVKFYRPLARLFWAAEYNLFGDNAGSWHLVGVLLYAANAALVYLLTWRLTKRLIPALTAGLFFALHPSHTEPVSWIAAQTDLLAALFGLSGLIFYIQARQASSRGQVLVNYGLALTCFALAMLSKESAAGFFVVPLLYEVVFAPYSRATLAKWRRSDGWLRQIGRLAVWQLPFWVLLGLFLGLRLVLLGGLGGYEGSSTDKLVPLNLFIESYGRWLLSPLNLERTLFRFGLLALALGLLVGLLWWERQQAREKAGTTTSELAFRFTRTLLFGFGWIILFLLPTITTSPSVRFVYLSSVGLAILLATLLAPLGEFGLKSLRTGKFFEGRTLLEKIQQSPITSGLKLLLALVWLGLALPEVTLHQSRWLQSSQTTRSILAQLRESLPDLVNYSYIYAAGLPRANEEASIFNTGFPEAIQIVYNNPTLVGESVPNFPIIEQHLLQGHLFEYQYQVDGNGRLVARPDLIEFFKQRNDFIKDKKEQLYIDWKPLQATGQAAWAIVNGKGNLSPTEQTLRFSLPEGGTFRPPVFQLSAPGLSNFEIKLRATPLNPSTGTVQIVVHWLVETSGGSAERTSAPLVIQSDGRSHTYRIRPLDMSPFLYKDKVSEIQLEVPPGLVSVEIEQAALYRLP